MRSHDFVPANPAVHINEYTYDAAGRMTAASGPRGLEELAYDGLNRLVSADTGGGAKETSYTYDQSGRLVIRKEAEGSNASENIFLPFAQSQEVAGIYDGSNGNNLYSYTCEPSGKHISQTDSTTSTTTYPFRSPRSDVLALTDTTGSITHTFAYEPFGEMEEGYTGDGTPFLYQDDYLDESTSLYQMQARWYDPSTSLFTSQDPQMGDASDPSLRSPYAYCADDPVFNTDPTGNGIWFIDFLRSLFGGGQQSEERSPLSIFGRGRQPRSQNRNSVRVLGKTLTAVKMPTHANLSRVDTEEQAFSLKDLAKFGGSKKSIMGVLFGGKSSGKEEGETGSVIDNFVRINEWARQIYAAKEYIAENYNLPEVQFPKDWYEKNRMLYKAINRIENDPTQNPLQKNTLETSIKFFDIADLARDRGNRLLDYKLWVDMWGGDPMNLDYKFGKGQIKRMKETQSELSMFYEVGTMLMNSTDPQERYRAGLRSTDYLYKTMYQEGYMKDLLMYAFQVPGTSFNPIYTGTGK